MSKQKEVKRYKERINWKKELSLLPGYLILCIWVAFTAAFLLWILGASFSTSREIFTGTVFQFESGFHFENYVNAWKKQQCVRILWKLLIVFGGFLYRSNC